MLITPYKLSADTRKRMEIMTESNDGFVTTDLKLRGLGDLEDTQQSRIFFSLKIADLVCDNSILFCVREIAEGIVEKDSKLSHSQSIMCESRS